MIAHAAPVEYDVTIPLPPGSEGQPRQIVRGKGRQEVHPHRRGAGRRHAGVEAQAASRHVSAGRERHGESGDRQRKGGDGCHRSVRHGAAAASASLVRPDVRRTERDRRARQPRPLRGHAGSGQSTAFELEPGIYRVKVAHRHPGRTRSPSCSRSSRASCGSADRVRVARAAGGHEHVARVSHGRGGQRRAGRRTCTTAPAARSFSWCATGRRSDDSNQQPKRITEQPGGRVVAVRLSAARARKVCDLARRGDSNLDYDAWTACTIEVTPGVYELRLELPTGGARCTSRSSRRRGWQTQAFVFMRAYRASDGAGRGSGAPISRAHRS